MDTSALPCPETPELPSVWPHNKRRQLPEGHDRQLISSARGFACYRNGGQYKTSSDPEYVPPFSPTPNRAIRRANGQRGDLYGVYWEPRTSPRAHRPYDAKTPRTTVHERQRRRAPGRVASVMRGQPLTPAEVASGRYLLANEAQADVLRDLMRAI